MKTKVNNKAVDSNITIFRYRVEALENKLTEEHEVIKNDIAIPLGKDLAAMNKPEFECTKDVYSGVINGAYAKMMQGAKKEVQSEIESYHIISEKEEADKQLEEFSKELELKETDHRIKKRELDKCDNSLLKKAKRYGWIRFFLVFLIFIDLFVTSIALQSMGYSLIVSYGIGLAIGVGIFFLAENLPEIIAKGQTPMQRRLITLAIFSGLFILFYVLGIFRSESFSENDEFGSGVHPIYFTALNMFFAITASLVVYFNGLKKHEKKILDQYKLTKEALQQLEAEIKALKEQIQKVRKTQAESELARRQIQIYAHDIQELVQKFFEESQKTFYSTNLIHRSDGKTPKFFEDDIPQLPSFYKGLDI
ncbi:hypothetical protein ACFSTE_09320 [Aquimarina hainanensis]|uniref:MFS transporter n=1 Tax=Aquimarina hainanensis TaxID=1578017 RepID=A0ABW5N992_9FLAO